MVSIRLQRTGRRRHAQFRVVVQDSHFTPTSGRVVANLGFYNPHTKEHNVDLKKAAVYLKNGAQPSPRLVKFFIDQKVDLPAWVKKPTQRSAAVKNPDKLRRNRPQEEVTPEVAEAPTEAVTEVAPDKKEDAAVEPAAKEESAPVTEPAELKEVAAEESEPAADQPADSETDTAETAEGDPVTTAADDEAQIKAPDKKEPDS